MRAFDVLSEREVLALAIANEEEDGRIYADFAEHLRNGYPDSARVFDDMAAEEDTHRRALLDLYVERFGRHIPYVTRREVRGLAAPASPGQVARHGVGAMRDQARRMEEAAGRFYRQAAARSTDAGVRKLLGDLAAAEMEHLHAAVEIESRRLPGDRREREDDAARRRFVLQVVQPGLVGLMDGSVSTLAPVFAAAFATHHPGSAFLVGLAASLGAGISMGLAEALADDGKLSGRGAPLLRGTVCGLMTAAGGIGHTLPFLIPQFWPAVFTACAAALVELGAIALGAVALHADVAPLGRRQSAAGGRGGALRWCFHWSRLGAPMQIDVVRLNHALGAVGLVIWLIRSVAIRLPRLRQRLQLASYNLVTLRK